MAEVTPVSSDINISQVHETAPNCHDVGVNETESFKCSPIIVGNNNNNVVAQGDDAVLEEDARMPASSVHQNSAVLGDKTTMLSRRCSSLEIKMDICNNESQLRIKGNQDDDSKISIEAPAGSCDQLLLNNQQSTRLTDASILNQQETYSSLPFSCMMPTGNYATILPHLFNPINKPGLLPHEPSTAAVHPSQNTAYSLPVATSGPLTTSNTVLYSATSTPFVIPSQQTKEIPSTSLTSVIGLNTEITSCSSSTCLQGNPHSLVTLPKIPASFPNFSIQKGDTTCASSLSSASPQNLLLTPVTVCQNGSAANNVVASSVTPLSIPNDKTEGVQCNLVSSVVSTVSTDAPLPLTISVVPSEVPATMNNLATEAKISVPNSGTVISTTSITETPSFTCNKDVASVSTADDSNFVPEILTVFSNFTPCRKCNSLLVCSCPGSSTDGQDGDGGPSACCTSCEGVCTCTGKTVEQTVVPNIPDVKPQVFPEVPLNRLDQLFDSLVEYNKVAKAEQPEAITTRLFPYQLQALNWMMTKENNTDLAPFWTQVNKSTWINKGTNISTDRKPDSPKGGILADDMGLGKTLTVITLIMANHLNGQPIFSRRLSSQKRAASTLSQDTDCKAEPMEKMPRRDSNDGDDDMMDDKDAVKKVTVKKRKGVEDKKKRLADSKTLKQPGFKFRQMYLSKFSSKSVKKEKYKDSKPKLPSPIKIDDDDDTNISIRPWLSADGRNKGSKSSNSRSSDDDHAATLIVCPLSVLSNWTDQICSHVHPDVNLQVYMYYGPERLRDVKFLREQDIVLTTYPTLTNDYSRNDSPLHKIKWLRVILDEGHTIRNPQTRLTKAMMDLAAKRRWVLTGTPIQNRLDDLWSVVKFLRLEPFDDKHWWNSTLASSVRQGCQQAVNRLQKLLKHISIRRLKSDEDEGKPLVKLPPRTVVIQEVELSQEERELYDAMQNHGQLVIGRYLRDGMVLKKYAHCFAILMRLRQLCLHPSLCAKECESLQHAQNLLQGIDDSDDDDLGADYDTQRLINDLLVTLSSGVDEECSVCLDSLVEPVITRCAHVFCQQCIMDVITSENFAPNCPLCRAPVNENDLIKVPDKKKKKSTDTEKPSEESRESKKSSKLETLLNALVAIRDKDPSTKSLVVSQFTSFLDIVEDALKKQDFQFVRLDGRMAQEARARAIETFSEPSSSAPTVFLLSLTAGGVGLNLTAATRVFLLDPAWNPAVEEQCFDRSHRLGQTKEVIITKYIVTNSVEERMLSMQEKKRELMGQAFGMETQSHEDRRRARVRDIKHLIGL